MSSYIYVKNPNGKTYVYENTTYWDKNTKSSKHNRKCIGHLDPLTNQILPNRKKGDVHQDTQAKSCEKTPRCDVMGCGIALLLNHISTSIGLEHILKRAFPDDWQKILTCAYYLISEGGALCHTEKWSAQNRSPYGATLTSQRISELLLRITPGQQQTFFKAWIDANRNDEYFCMDISSVSSYSDCMDFVRYGYNRDNESLPQVNLLMVTGEESHLPLYYRLIPGSIKDVSTLKESLAHFELLDARRLRLVMDKGFYSKANVDALYASHTKFTIGVPFTATLAKEAVAKSRENDMTSHHNYCVIAGDELYAASSLTSWEGHRCYVHTYYDSLKAELENKKFNHLIMECYNELVAGNTCKAHESYYSKFFTVKETPKRGRKVEYNEEALKESRQNHVGWFVMITNDVKDREKALEIYRGKDAVEKSFDDLKNDLDMKRLRIHSTAAMEGRIFIQYIALILSARIKVIMNAAGWFKNHDMQEVIDEMKSLREVKIEGGKKTLTTTLTSFQREIVQLFGLAL